MRWPGGSEEPLGHFEFEEPSEGVVFERWGLMVAGETVLWMALLPAALIWASFRDGSRFWLWFTLALLAFGSGLAALAVRLAKRGRLRRNWLDRATFSKAGKP
jgi:hypothetical protein